MSEVATGQDVEQTAENAETKEPKPLMPGLAAVLSLLGGPLGQVYAGRLRRSVVWWGASLVYLALLSLAFVSLPLHGNSAAVAVFGGSLAFPILMAIDAYWVARKERHAPRKAYQRVPAYVLLFIVFTVGHNFGAAVTRTFISEAFMVPAWSMYPTFDPGDRFIIDKLWYKPAQMKRNDLVVYFGEGPDALPQLKRVVGLPGDVVEIVDEKVLINGEAWNDEHRFIDQEVPLAPEQANYGPLTVPDGSFFVLGDNRRRSEDSRSAGPIPFANLLGQAKLIYWSSDVAYTDHDDYLNYEYGPTRWDRIGKRLD